MRRKRKMSSARRRWEIQKRVNFNRFRLFKKRRLNSITKI